MVIRGERKSRNKWVKNESPMVQTDEGTMQRLPPRATAKIQVIPDSAFNEYGDRKITGFTLDEIRRARDTGEPVILRDRRKRKIAELKVGAQVDEWTKAELDEIVKAIEKEGVLMTASPMGPDEREAAVMQQVLSGVAGEQNKAREEPEEEEPAAKKRGRPRKDASEPVAADA